MGKEKGFKGRFSLMDEIKMHVVSCMCNENELAFGNIGIGTFLRL